MTLAIARPSTRPAQDGNDYFARVLSPILDALETGVAVIEATGNVRAANEAFLTLFGFEQAELLGIASSDLRDRVAERVDHAPRKLAERRMLGDGVRVACEEFELTRPRRSVVRWVARAVRIADETTQVIACSDITNEVDLAAAQARVALADPLTGLLNRRGVREAAEREVARSRRSGTPLTVVLLDVDHFKRVNDTHGHGEGDRILRELALLLRRSTRRSDIVSRWGGEEFLLLLPETPASGGVAWSERFRRCVAETSLLTDVPVTVSLGVAELADGEPLDVTIARADERLYAAKAAGRNRCAS